jgi:hypothetical protein
MFHDKIPVPNVVQRLIRFKESSVKRWLLLNFLHLTYVVL